MRFRFSLLGLLGLTTLCGLAAGALVQPSSLWLSLIVSLTALAIIVQTVRVLLETGTARAAAVGWLLFAVSYLAITLGPWFKANWGSQLATSRGISVAVESAVANRLWLDQSPSPAEPIYFNTNTLDANLSLLVADSYDIGGPSSVPRDRGELAPVYLFTQSAHWLSAWLAGWLGAAIAMQLASRRRVALGRASEPRLIDSPL